MKKSVIMIVFALVLICYSVPLFSAERIIFGITPWDDDAKLKAAFKPVFDRIEKDMGIETKFVVAKNYEQLGELVKSGKIDIGFFSPGAYVDAKNKYSNLKYILTLSKLSEQGKVVDYYEGYIFTKKDAPYNSIEDLKGKKFGFTQKTSSSGYKYPMSIFSKMNINPDEYFSKVFFLGKHPDVTDAVLNGNVDAGATWDGHYENVVNAKGDVFKIIKKTPPIPFDAWAANENVDPELIKNLKKVLLSIKPDDPAVNGPNFPYKGWVERDDSFYDVVRDVNKIFKK